MTAEFFAQSSEAANVDLWPVRSSSRALPGGAKGAFTMAVLRRRTAGRSDDVFAQRSLRLATLEPACPQGSKNDVVKLFNFF